MTEQADPFRLQRSALALVTILTCLVGAMVIIEQAGQTATYTIDSYFYLSKAKQIANGDGPTTSWNDGIDSKYLPGYSYILSVCYLLGKPFVFMNVALYVVCALSLFAVARECDLQSGTYLGCAAFLASPVVIKWFSLPMAESAALALSLISLVCFMRYVLTGRYASLFLAGAAAGFAIVTRVESAFLFPIFFLLIFTNRAHAKALPLLAGAVLAALPPLLYWIWLRANAGESPAYFEEFRSTVLRTDVFANFAYNVWVPFGFMHWPIRSVEAAAQEAATIVAGVAWLSVGQLIFLGGLLFSLFGKLGAKIRAVSLLFLAYAFLHSFWYYRYERFMLMAVPLAAIIWAAAVGAALEIIPISKQKRLWLMAAIQVLIAISGIYLGQFFSSRHIAELQKDTGWIPFHHVASVVNSLNRPARSPVLTDLGPHLAYHIESHTYLDTQHGNYWRRAFQPEETLENLNMLGIRFVVTKRSFSEWLKEHDIPSDKYGRFRNVAVPAQGIYVIEYAP